MSVGTEQGDGDESVLIVVAIDAWVTYFSIDAVFPLVELLDF